jgi:hypothetical protein
MRDYCEISSKLVLLEYLNQAVNQDIFKGFFSEPEPIPEFPVHLAYSARLIVPLSGETHILGAFDGKFG